MSISKTISQYTDWNQLAEYCSAQEQTILQLSRKIKKLEDERDQLKVIAQNPTAITQTEGPQFTNDDSEFICVVEIAKLKKVTFERELTYEEAKRLDTYFKILSQINLKNNSGEKEAQKLPDEELLKIVESNDNGK